MLSCDEFDSDEKLKTIFADPRMEPWCNNQPSTIDKETRVNATINLLNGRADKEHNSALALLLYVLKDHTHPGTEFYGTLDALVKDLENELEFAPQGPSPKSGISSRTLRIWGLLVSIALLVLFSPPFLHVTPVAGAGLAGLAGLCLYAVYNSIKGNYKPLLVALIIIVTLGAGYGLYYLSVPHFKITALNTLEGDHNAYEFSDLLIMEYGRLENYGVDLALEVEVKPFYVGSRSRGKIVAYISGEADATPPEQILWMDFSRSSEAKTMILSLPELLAVSGLAQNRDSFYDNLVRNATSPFQQRQIEVQIKSEDNRGRT